MNPIARKIRGAIGVHAHASDTANRYPVMCSCLGVSTGEGKMP